MGTIERKNGLAEQGLWEPIRRYSALGLDMGLSVVIGYLIGAFLDRRLHTTPLFLLVFLLLGTAAGFRELYRAARQIQRDAQKDDDAPSSSNPTTG